ncbi:hypothetical protein B5G50_21440 [Brevibacillus brevis]|uniref:hypothetical protein n=1 Tax=Brevibacillus brevis TaxID=1393 RepID=UPI000B36E018|nr:hypothetical protein [Brevibacillus brevis]OUQ86499.1 hypothetical protein B5G50_21440 [Brevibacillus brevis]
MSQLLIKAKSLVPAIEETINLAIRYNMALESFETMNPIPDGEKPSFEHWEAFHTDVEIIQARESIEKHLFKLTYDEVVIIQSIMYIGRDERDVNEYLDDKELVQENGGEFIEETGVFDSPQKKIFEYLKYLKGQSNSKEDIVGSMISKAPFHNI